MIDIRDSRKILKWGGFSFSMSSMLSHLIISGARRENVKNPKGGLGWEKLF